jgi:hypothetical protein
MEATDDEGLPLFPASPEGVPRMNHLPTVKASIHYWDAVRARASSLDDLPRYRVAAALIETYEAAHQELVNAGRAAEPKAAPRQGRVRLRRETTRDGTTG